MKIKTRSPASNSRETESMTQGKEVLHAEPHKATAGKSAGIPMCMNCMRCRYDPTNPSKMGVCAVDGEVVRIHKKPCRYYQPRGGDQ